MESPHSSQENAVNHQSKKYELANRQKLSTIDDKQTPNLQNHIKTYLNIRDRTVGLQQTLQHKSSTNIPAKNVTLNNKGPMVRIQSNPSCRSWNTLDK
jgi:hypothetical protein